MKTTAFLAALAAFLLAAPSASFAQDSGSFSFGKPKAAAPADLVTVQAKGQGESVEAAKKDAVRNAIKIAVGELVGAKTLVENDELVEDKILTLSNAMIEKADYGDAKSVGDGLFEVPVTAVVKKGQLNKKLEDIGIAKGAVAGDSLAAKLFAGQERVANAEKFFSERLKDFPKNVMEAVMLTKEDGSPNIEADETSGHVYANIGIQINLENYAKFAQALQELLGAVCTEKETKDISFEESSWGNQGFLIANGVIRKFGAVVVATPKKPHRMGWPVSVYYLDATMYEVMAKVIESQFPKTVVLGVVLKDEDGETVVGTKGKIVSFGAQDNYNRRDGGCLPIHLDTSNPRQPRLYIAPYAGVKTSNNGSQEAAMVRPKDSMPKFRLDLGKVPEEDLGEVAGYEIKLEFN